MNRLDFTELVATLKGGSLKSVGFKLAELANFDGIRYQMVVDAWLAKMEDYIHVAECLPTLGDIRPWNLSNPT
jgi:hypothetical protein